ncbi:MAG: hypothetical protein KIT58_24170 [Planctomycetota bacterium]|nr:hypothetical protein [Planctomycetota bacterium]
MSSRALLWAAPLAALLIGCTGPALPPADLTAGYPGRPYTDGAWERPARPDWPGRPYPNGAWGQPRPGKSRFGDPDWRYGEFRPRHVDPDVLLFNPDLQEQIDDSPAGVRVSEFPRGRDNTRVFVVVSSEDDTSPGPTPGGGMAVIRVPF